MVKQQLGIIGHPVAHSLSPLIHNFAAELLQLPYTYSAWDVAPADVAAAVNGIRALGIRGVNVTVPYKEVMLPLMDKLDDEAKSIGAVNTIINDDGVLTGSNTDGIGFIRSLHAEGFNPAGKSVSLIGAGGSARAIGASLLRAGAASVTVINRGQSNGSKLVTLLEKFGKSNLLLSGSKEALAAANESDLVVQSTPLGMKAEDALPLAGVEFQKGQFLYDIIYAPEETELLKQAKAAGATAINGLGMLLYQASEAFYLWTGKKFPEQESYKKLKQFLRG